MTARAVLSEADLQANFFYKPGIAGGQLAYGGVNAGDLMTLQGSDNADVGRIAVNSPTEFFYSEGNTTPAEQSCVRWRPTFTTIGAYIGGWFANNAAITYTNSFYIYSSIQDNSTHISNAAAGFQAWTLFNALCSLNNGTSNDTVQAITLNDGVTHRRTTAGTTTVIQHIGFSFSGAIRADVASATLTLSTGMTGLSFAPKHNTQVASSTVNYGTLNAVACVDVAAALFAFSNGTETMTAYNGLFFPDMSFIASGAYSVVRSQLVAGTNKRFLNHTGTAISILLGQLRFDADLTGVTFGASQDVQMGWGGAGFFFMQFNGLADQIRISNPSADRFLFDSATDSEWNFHTVDGFSVGNDIGALGNTFGAFVTAARATKSAGEWADFNLTHAANLTLDHAMTALYAWNINSLSITTGGGSLTGPVSSFNVGGMTTSGLGGNETQAFRHTGRRTARGVDAFPALEPAQLTADVNDYAPATGNSMRQVWSLTSDASRRINGIAVQQQDDVQWIHNSGSNDIVLGHQDAGSAAANRIISPTGADYTLGANESALLWYDRTNTRWKILWGTGA